LKSIVFFNNKGGVGKTTLTTNIASYLNDKKGKRVLLIDADPQCNATQSFLTDELCQDIYFSGESECTTLYDFVRPIEEGNADISKDYEPVLGSNNGYCTDMIPGHPRMSIIEDKLSDAWNKLLSGDIGGIRITNWCNNLLDIYKNRYDIVIFDVGPSLGALNRSVLLSSDYIMTPLGCDIFSLLGISNISLWMNSWRGLYLNSLELSENRSPAVLQKYNVVDKIENKFQLIGFSVQQYISRKFKKGPRPVKAYDKIMREIPATIIKYLDFITPATLGLNELELGHIPYLYSLIPISQSARKPIHKLEHGDGVVGQQFGQIKEYDKLIDSICDKLIRNMDLLR
jgi:cellulose biosynthesis protein BcsQ